MSAFPGRVLAAVRKVGAGGGFLALISASGLILIAKLVGASKEVAIAAKFGTGQVVDTYNLLFALMNWPMSVWNEVLIAVMVPVVARHGLGASDRFVQVVARRATALGCVVALGFVGCLALGLFPKEWSLGSGGSMAWLPLAASIPCGFAASVWGAVLIGRQRKISNLLDGVPSLLLVLAIIIVVADGATVLAWGTSAGFLVQLVACYAIAKLWVGEGGRAPLEAAEWRAFWKSLALVGVGQMITVAGTSVIDQLMVTSLGAGANATLGYSNRLTMLVLGMGAMAAARVTLPIFSKLSGSDDVSLHRAASRWAAALFGLGAVIGVVGWFLAPIGISLLFERGSFTHSDTMQVSAVFRLSLLQVPFYFANIIVVQLIISKGKYNFFLITSFVQLAVKYAANHFLIERFGLAGVPIASAVRAAEALLFGLLFLRLAKI